MPTPEPHAEQDETERDRVRFVVGLGNPGRRYRDTRHNAGFLAVDAIVGRLGLGRGRKRFRSRVWETEWDGDRLILAEPQTYMNLSGEAVRDLVAFHRPEAAGDEDRDLRSALLVVFDDLDLEPGRLRFRGRGSSGGHRGVRSMIDELRTERFSRLKVGIGRAADEPEAGGDSSSADYVLERLGDDELSDFRAAADRAAEAAFYWLANGVDASANRFNAPAPSAPPADETPGET